MEQLTTPSIKNQEYTAVETVPSTDPGGATSGHVDKKRLRSRH
jgi:hypothetical protein